MSNSCYYIAADANGDIYVYNSTPVRRIISGKKYWTSSTRCHLKIIDGNSGYTDIGKFFPITADMEKMTWDDNFIQITIEISNFN